MKINLLVIVGPTASGKSELAVQLAKKFNGEIVSADSRQMYRGLNVGTAKVRGKWVTRKLETKNTKRKSTAKTQKLFRYKGVTHYCIDVSSPRRVVTVAEYKKTADRAIQNIAAAGKLPILVGGTWFWIDAVAEGLHLPEVLPNTKLRRELEQKSPAELHALLLSLDPQRATDVDRKNPRRLIRAIEIARALGRVPRLTKHRPYRTLWLGVLLPPGALERSITLRSQSMLRRGLAAETKKLLAGGISKRRIRELGFEYQTALRSIEGRTTRAEFLLENLRLTRQYALRQLRQFRKNPRIRWIRNITEAEREIRVFIQAPPHSRRTEQEKARPRPDGAVPRTM